MKKNRVIIITLSITIIFIVIIFAIKILSPKHKTPKLVIGIVVDQMSYEFIPRYWGKYSEGGFKRLINYGYFFKNANFIHFPTYTAPGHSCIYTGTVPSVNGIIGNDWLLKGTNELIYCAEDTTVHTVGSFSDAGKMSPVSLLTTTITDKLRFTTNMKSKVISIALKDRGGIFPGGRLANAVYWYDEASKNWITSSYYMQKLPQWVEDFNKKYLPDFYLSSNWNTMLPIEEYTESLPDDNPYEDKYKGEEKPIFPHDLPELKYRNEHLLTYTPFGNTLTKEFAIETIKNENLGKSENTDFLCISFSSTDFVGHKFGPNSIEVEDTYLRIDYDIAKLLEYLDNNIGMDNVLIFLTADHGICINPGYLKEMKFDAGTFFHRIVLDSVNNFLFRTYNKKNLGLYFINQQIYLNHKLIDSSGILMNDILKKTADYIKQNIEGVRNIYTSEDLCSIVNTDEYFSFFKNSFYEQRCGDVFVNFKPYWIEDRVKGAEHGSPYYYDTHVPLIWYGCGIVQGESSEQINMTDIAPTLSELLNIGYPDGCIGKPIKQIINP